MIGPLAFSYGDDVHALRVRTESGGLHVLQVCDVVQAERCSLGDVNSAEMRSACAAALRVPPDRVRIVEVLRDLYTVHSVPAPAAARRSWCGRQWVDPHPES